MSLEFSDYDSRLESLSTTEAIITFCWKPLMNEKINSSVISHFQIDYRALKQVSCYILQINTSEMILHIPYTNYDTRCDRVEVLLPLKTGFRGCF